MRNRKDRGTILLVVTVMGILMLGASSLYLGAITHALRRAQRLENKLAASHQVKGLFEVTRHRIAQGKITGKHQSKGGDINRHGEHLIQVTPAGDKFDVRIQLTITRKIPERTIVEIKATLARQGDSWKIVAFKQTSRLSNPHKVR